MDAEEIEGGRDESWSSTVHVQHITLGGCVS